MKINLYNIFFLLLIFFIALQLSFRTDYLFNSDHGFHLSYFIQPIVGIESGYKLLLDQPSQYGFLNILIPHILDINGPINSFHIFQGVLNIITIFIAFFIAVRILKLKNYSFFIFLFSIILLLSSTDLFGPQVYPSTGVVRFFPVYILILCQCFIRCNNIGILKETLLLGICFFSSLMWGSEASFYVLFSIGFYYLQELLYEPCIKKLKEVLFKGFSIITISITLSYIVLKIYQNSFDIESLNLGLHFSYLMAYSYGFGMTLGAIIPNIFSPILLITVPLLLALIMNRKNKENYLTIACYGSIIIAVISYSFMRSIANNINNLWPIFFLCFSIIYYEMKDRNSEEENYSLKVILLPTVLIASLCFSNIVINYKKIPEIMSTYSFTIDNNLFKKSFQLEEEDKSILKEIEKIDWKKSSLSILTWSGKTGNTFNENYKPFLPGPSVSMTYHSDDYIEKIFRNSYIFKNRNGYILHDKKWNTYENILKIVKNIKSCKSLIQSNRYDFYECYSVEER